MSYEINYTADQPAIMVLTKLGEEAWLENSYVLCQKWKTNTFTHVHTHANT